jgi:hypothetical protein
LTNIVQPSQFREESGNIIPPSHHRYIHVFTKAD